MSEQHSETPVTRRDFLRSAAVGALAASPIATLACRASSAAGGAGPTPAGDVWAMLPQILARIVPPTFPARDFDVTNYGAVGDGRADCSAAFRAAIAACTQAGGGHVVVPAGRFVTGPIHLASNVDLHVTRDATILFSRDTRQYLPAVLTRFEGTELMNYSPFIYALDCENVGVTGDGTLDGQADDDHWWSWKGLPAHGWKPGMPNYNASRQRLLAMAEQGVPVAQRVFGEGDYLRPNFIQPYRSRNILIENVHIVNSPMWEVHPVLCTNVTVRGVKIRSHGPNNDGCDPESCRDVLIERCVFDTGDDCIAIKSGRNADGRRVHVPSEYIVVRECEMRDGHGGVTVGSEISGDCRWVFAERNALSSPNLDMALRLKNNAARGGVIEHIYMRDCTVGQVRQAVLSIDFNYEEGAKGAFTPVVRDVEMRNVKSGKSEYAIYLRGFASSPVRDVRVIDCTFTGVEKGNLVENVQGLALAGTTVNGKRVTA